jgi:hypothetical protein
MDEETIATDINPDPNEAAKPPAPNPEIEELKKQMAEMAKLAADKDNYIAQMQERTLQAMERQAQPVAPAEDPYADVDPQVRKYIDAQNANLQRQLMDTKNQLASSIAAHDTLQVLDQHGITDAKTRAVATQMASKFKAAGLALSPNDAVVFTLGQMALQNGGKLDLNQQDPPRRGGPDVIKGGTRSVAPQNTAPAYPDNWDDLDPDTQIAFLEKRGVGKQPL